MTDYKIRKGWRRVARGISLKTDHAWRRDLDKFAPLQDVNVGVKCSAFFCLIRKIKT
jgi:hypothetical protein